MVLIRYTARGNLGGIATFTAPGILNSSLRAIVVDPDDDSIIAVGSSDAVTGSLTVVRFNADGTPDTTFGDGDGYITENFGSACSVALQPSDGKIVISGRAQNGNLLVARFDPDGTLDTSEFAPDGTPIYRGFGTNGQGYAADLPINPPFPAGRSVLVQSDGKIVVAGTFVPAGGTASAIGIVRYNSDGTPDASF
jgi:uncharacterized delta-60 repeat protein